jgi:hypothetical protein
MHCQLETVSELAILQCNFGSVAASDPASHCDDSGCCSAETGQYQLPQNEMSIGPNLLVVVSCVPLMEFGRCLPSEVWVGVLTAAPPDIPRPWQFFIRAAIPVRAPSLVS